MISIKLSNIQLATIENIISLSKKSSENAEIETDMEKSVESLVESYLTADNSNKPELSKLLHSLNEKEISEILALYYFFSKMTYGTEEVTKEGPESFWKLCQFNAMEDITQKNIVTMIDYLQERPNLSVILSTALINLE